MSVLPESDAGRREWVAEQAQGEPGADPGTPKALAEEPADKPEPPPPPPATETDCRKAFEHLVAMSVAETRQRWLRIGRVWDDAARDEAVATVRDGEARYIAGCLRAMTRTQTACQTSARTPAAWRQCSGAKRR